MVNCAPWIGSSRLSSRPNAATRNLRVRNDSRGVIPMEHRTRSTLSLSIRTAAGLLAVASSAHAQVTVGGEVRGNVQVDIRAPTVRGPAVRGGVVPATTVV